MSESSTPRPGRTRSQCQLWREPGDRIPDFAGQRVLQASIIVDLACGQVTEVCSQEMERSLRVGEKLALRTCKVGRVWSSKRSKLTWPPQEAGGELLHKLFPAMH